MKTKNKKSKIRKKVKHQVKMWTNCYVLAWDIVLPFHLVHAA